MQYGIYLPNFGPYGDARVLASLARDAENAGWDGFFLWDHMAGHALPFVDPWVALTAIALNTQRIRVGTTVTPLPRRRPWKIARETVSLDHLSGGRLTLGVGIGLGEAEWDDLGEETDLKKRGEMLDEALNVLVGLWSGEPFSYAGKYYHIAKAHFLPKPLQQPRIPIWVGGFWPNKTPFRRAAQWDGMFPLFDVWTETERLAQLEAVIAYVRERCQQEHPLDIVCMGMTPGAEPAQAAATVAQRAQRGATWWLELIGPYILGKDLEDEWPLEAMRERVLQGPPTIA
jgi:alkanesulfonate monooxygenase SsuD/methylene tetrahydromethanopterin reductase-like flavin-dependent oxidoreductase (luciferase family)